MRDKIIKILSNWLTFMDKEKLNKLRIDKNKNGKSKLKNEQYINFNQISIDNSFFNIKLSNEQYEEFKIISKYFNFLTLSPDEKEKFLKEDEIDDKIYILKSMLNIYIDINSYGLQVHTLEELITKDEINKIDYLKFHLLLYYKILCK